MVWLAVKGFQMETEHGDNTWNNSKSLPRWCSKRTCFKPVGRSWRMTTLTTVGGHMFGRFLALTTGSGGNS